MKKEFGKWLIDISKYIATAIIISSVFEKINTWVMYAVAIVSVGACLVCGLILTTNLQSLSFRRNRKSNN